MVIRITRSVFSTVPTTTLCLLLTNMASTGVMPEKTVRNVAANIYKKISASPFYMKTTVIQLFLKIHYKK